MRKPSASDEAKAKFKALKELESEGLSNITVYLLQYRQYIKENFIRTYNEEERLLYKAVNNNEVIPRFINNYAAMVAVCRLISDQESLPFNLVHFRELARKTLLEQHFILKGSDTIGKFWSIVENLFNQDIIKEEIHFKLKNGLLYIRIQDIYQHYAEMMQKRKDAGALDEATLKNYLEHDPKAFVERKKIFFGGAQRWCFIFKYEELGIDLIRANSKEELKAKLMAMGIKFNDDEEDQVPAAPAPEPKPAPAQQIVLKMKPKYEETNIEVLDQDNEEPPF